MRKMLNSVVTKLGRSEKGFTLVEMLVVIGIIVALAAVIVPTVIKFSGSGETGAKAAELDSFQAAVDIMLADKKLTTVAAGATAATVTSSTDFDASAATLNITEYLRDLPTEFCYTWTTGGCSHSGNLSVMSHQL